MKTRFCFSHLAAPEDDVDEASHEGGVESILRRKTGNQSIGDTWRRISIGARIVRDVTLRDDSETHSDASDEVGESVSGGVGREPGEEGQAGPHQGPHRGHGAPLGGGRD